MSTNCQLCHFSHHPGGCPKDVGFPFVNFGKNGVNLISYFFVLVVTAVTENQTYFSVLSKLVWQYQRFKYSIECLKTDLYCFFKVGEKATKQSNSMREGGGSACASKRSQAKLKSLYFLIFIGHHPLGLLLKLGSVLLLHFDTCDIFKTILGSCLRLPWHSNFLVVSIQECSRSPLRFPHICVSACLHE